MKDSPFTKEKMNEIFRISSKYPECIQSRESTWIEFKESFGWNSCAKYIKSFAAFANTKGGYLIFGIHNKPHIMYGLKDKNLELFKEIDPEKMSNNLNDHFSPEIKWSIHEHELGGKIFGLFYIYESEQKPVMCIKNFSDELKEGDIYYRYRGRTQRIKYPELRSIIDGNRNKEQQIWLDHLSKIARVGVSDAAIFDLKTGVVSGKSGAFIIDESLLSKLSFIKEGEFSEVNGEPALKLIGNLEAVEMKYIDKKEKIIKSKGIRTDDIVLSFLSNEKVPDPLEYIKQICYESSSNLPVYYYIKKSEKNISEIVQILNNAITRSPSKKRLIDKIQDINNTYFTGLPSGKSDAALKKQEYKRQLLKKLSNPNSIDTREIRIFLQVIYGLKKDEIIKNSEYLKSLLKEWFCIYYSNSKQGLANDLRRAICWIDEALFK